jgi:glycosyltransferase involved in cell wall biosynthesis
MRKVIHLLPYDGIGGAEAAARSMAGARFDGLDFHLAFIFPEVRSSTRRGATFNPLALLRSALSIRRAAPDLLVLSLWRSCLVGLIVKLLRPRTRLVVMIHNSVDAHAGDWLFTRLAMAVATAIWADSEASLSLRFHRVPRRQVAILPFLTDHLSPVARHESGTDVAPGFIFWGRLAAQKNLRRALEIMGAIRATRADAWFTVIGPDGGQLEELRQWTKHAGLAESVAFAGPMSFDGIRSVVPGHSFYLQTSDYEGMAMSVVEAMQLGLVPVVTPVGEIARYCRDGLNGVLATDVDATTRRLVDLLSEPARYDTIRDAAIATWAGHPLYRDAFANECRHLLNLTDP